MLLLEGTGGLWLRVRLPVLGEEPPLPDRLLPPEGYLFTATGSLDLEELMEPAAMGLKREPDITTPKEYYSQLRL